MEAFFAFSAGLMLGVMIMGIAYDNNWLYSYKRKEDRNGTSSK